MNDPQRDPLRERLEALVVEFRQLARNPLTDADCADGIDYAANKLEAALRAVPAGEAATESFEYPCPRCSGTGLLPDSSQCFDCKGGGQLRGRRVVRPTLADAARPATSEEKTP